jgi:hypothetical protein
MFPTNLKDSSPRITTSLSGEECSIAAKQLHLTIESKLNPPLC